MHLVPLPLLTHNPTVISDNRRDTPIFTPKELITLIKNVISMYFHPVHFPSWTVTTEPFTSLGDWGVIFLSW